MSIHPLSDDIKSKLRTGVAISNVAQCVEELILNALDAGTTCVAVRIDLQCFKIQVVDSGVGLMADQLELVGQRYCTSKCHSMEDLENLQFFGFRGEALASIADMCSILELQSRHKFSNKTYHKIFKNGKSFKIFESAIKRPSIGTTVTVYDFMYNFPVRRKNASDILDFEFVRRKVEGIALIHPHISFSLRNDVTNIKCLQTYKTNSFLSVFNQLFGASKAKVLKSISHEIDPFLIKGYVGKEGHINKNMQFLYVNNRILLKSKIHKFINHIFSKSTVIYKHSNCNKLPTENISSSPSKLSERYAIFLLNIKCSREEYDICLDPNKTLIEFKNWDILLKCIKEVIYEFLKKENLISSQDSDDLILSQTFFKERKVLKNDDEEELIPALSNDNTKYGLGIKIVDIPNNLQSYAARRHLNMDEKLYYSDDSSCNSVSPKVISPVLLNEISNSNNYNVKDNLILSNNLKNNESCLTLKEGNIKSTTSFENINTSPLTILQNISKTSPTNLVHSQNIEFRKEIEKHKTLFNHPHLISLPKKSLSSSLSKLVCHKRKFSGIRSLDKFSFKSKAVPKGNSDDEYKKRHSEAKTNKQQNSNVNYNAIEKPLTDSTLQQNLFQNGSLKSNYILHRKYNIDSIPDFGNQNLNKRITLDEKVKEFLQEKFMENDNSLEDHSLERMDIVSYSTEINDVEEMKSNFSHTLQLNCDYPFKKSFFTNESFFQAASEVHSPIVTNLYNASSRDSMNINKMTTDCLKNNIIQKKTPANKSSSTEDEPSYSSWKTCRNSELKLTENQICNNFEKVSQDSDEFRLCKNKKFKANDDQFSYASSIDEKETFPLHSEIQNLSSECTELLFLNHLNNTKLDSVMSISKTTEEEDLFKLNDTIEKNEEIRNQSDKKITTFIKEDKQVTQNTNDGSGSFISGQPFTLRCDNHFYNEEEIIKGYLSDLGKVYDKEIGVTTQTSSESIRNMDSGLDENLTHYRKTPNNNILKENNEIKYKEIIVGDKNDIVPNLTYKITSDNYEMDRMATTENYNSLQSDLMEKYVEEKVNVSINESSSFNTEGKPESLIKDTNESNLISISEDVAAETHHSEKELLENQNNNTNSSSKQHISQIDLKTGNKIYIDQKTGHSFYTDPHLQTINNDIPSLNPNEVSSVMIDLISCRFFPDSAVPFLEACSNRKKFSLYSEKSTNISNLTDLWDDHTDNEMQLKWRESSLILKETDKTSPNGIEQLFGNWKNPILQSTEKEIKDICKSQASKKIQQVHQLLHHLKFTKDIFKHIQILQQIDNKFIACLISKDKSDPVPTILVLVDQHAAHERVLLEQLMSENVKIHGDKSKICSSKIIPSLDLKLAAAEVYMMPKFQKEMERIGIYFSLHPDDREIVTLHEVPKCLLEKDANERKRGRDSVILPIVEDMIKEHLETLQQTLGSSCTLPRIFNKLISSQACHGAVKFGDFLNRSECIELIDSLSRCQMPFQCAHGRPSFMPITDLKLLDVGTPNRISKLGLQSLKTKMEKQKMK